jgi:hypothetical protein
MRLPRANVLMPNQIAIYNEGSNNAHKGPKQPFFSFSRHHYQIIPFPWKHVQSIITRHYILFQCAAQKMDSNWILGCFGFNSNEKVCVHINYDETVRLFAHEIMHALTRLLLCHSLDSPLFNYQIQLITLKCHSIWFSFACLRFPLSGLMRSMPLQMFAPEI